MIQFQENTGQREGWTNPISESQYGYQFNRLKGSQEISLTSNLVMALLRKTLNLRIKSLQGVRLNTGNLRLVILAVLLGLW